MDVIELHRRACAEFGSRVEAIGPDAWGSSTPCTGWDVRALVAHVVDECRWTGPLLAGRTIAEVEADLPDDPLGSDPVGAWRTASAEALDAAAACDPDAIVHLSFGDHPARFYLAQLGADHLIHAWDLARGIGGDERLDPELVDEVAAWFATQEDAYRSGGVIAERAPVADDADAQTRLLAAFGRSA